MGVIQDAANDTLDVLDVGVAEGGRRVGREGTLGFAAKLLGLGSIRTMLRPGQGGMLVFLQLFDDITLHGNVEGACIVIPLEADAAVEISPSQSSVSSYFFFMHPMRWSMSS
jgi:hypothetical protein